MWPLRNFINRVSFECLALSVSFDTPQSRHFMRTFGYLHLPAFLDQTQIKSLGDDFIKQYEAFYNMPWRAIVASREARVMPAMADNSETASAILAGEACEKLVSYVLGDDFIFMGSDASLFFTGSPWHRDLFTLTPLLKINIYLDGNGNGEGGEFLVVPGSQFPGSVYADLLNNALAWPDKPANTGGMSETGFLPPSWDPREKQSDDMLKLPCAKMHVTPGDLVLFDLRAIHSVAAPKPAIMRRLITLIFAENPLSMPVDHYALVSAPHKTRQELYDEIIDVKALSHLRHGGSGYGTALLGHRDYVERHGLDFEYIKVRAEKMAVFNSALQKEDGRHSGVNMDAMSGFLNQNRRAVKA